MSIARMLHADIVCGAGSNAELVSRLEKAGILQVVDVHPMLPEGMGQLERRPGVDTADLDARLQRVRQVLETFDRFLPLRKGMLQGFFGSPPYVTEEELAALAGRLDLEAYAPRLRERADEHERLERELGETRGLMGSLAPWAGMDADLASLARLGRAAIVTVHATHAQHESLSAEIAAWEAADEVVWHEVSRDERTVHGAWATLAERRAGLEERIRRAGAAIVRLPDIPGTPREALERLAEESAGLERRRDRLAAELAAEAAERRPLVRALHDDLANRRRNLHVPRSFFSTTTVTVASGWVLERERGRLEKLAAEASADLVTRPPLPDESPPVLLENLKLLRPYQILLEMFGLPAYGGFDPTPFVAIAMTLFYAICFGDVGYGLVQVLLAWALKRKFRPAQGTRLFLDLFIEMGAAAAVFGLLTWSFFGTSPGYAAGGPKILGFLPLFTPTSDVLVIIGLALGIGVVFQLASLVAGMLAAIRAGDIAAAAFDFGAWFLMLVGILGWVAATMLPGVPAGVGTAALAITGASALVIVAFAGRSAKGVVGRILTGVISLYGIVGAYGIVSFFSDALSYSRLAILNLTSGFIALVGNLMGGLIVSTESVLTAIISLLLGTIIVVVFHALNLVLGMMGSFIHSLRLNYLESFSRYYRTGGTPFLPLRREGMYHRFEQ
jgi:V/A-type H+-transporting ATPase subunit I